MTKVADTRTKTLKVFQVMNETGEITRLVEAYTVAEVKAHLLGKTTIKVASALTVSRSGLKAEKVAPV